ncbi:MAG TPA: MaoC/PaaZ C-terminal domain-containing protein [Aggregatilineales bacterium]|nr:MaoC/PaaZ C-terminal domain-containing protein [Aggregatilineales bacterium]
MTDIRTHGLWFEEFTEGTVITSRGRTITESDIVAFAGLTGDFNSMHTNAEYMKTHQFGARVAHGALVFSIAIGQLYQLNILEGTIIAFTSFEMKMRLPVMIGDTIHATATVTGSRPMAAAGGGLVILDVKVLNQEDKVVEKGEWSFMVKSRPRE